MFWGLLAAALSVPQGCPAQPVFEQMVAAELGWPPDPSDYALTVVFDEKDGQYQADLRFRGGAAQNFRDGDCTALLNGVAVTLAVLIDPEQLGIPPKPASLSKGARPKEDKALPKGGRVTPKEPAPEIKAPLPDSKVSRAAKEKGEKQNWSALITTAVQGVAGSGPSPTFSGAARLQFFKGTLGFGAEGRVEVPAHLEILGGSATTQLTTGTLLGCGQWDPVWLCLRGSLGAVSVRSEGLSGGERNALLYGAPGFDIGCWLWRDVNWSVAASLMLEIPLTRTALTSGSEVVWESGPVLGALGLSASFEAGFH